MNRPLDNVTDHESRRASTDKLTSALEDKNRRSSTEQTQERTHAARRTPCRIRVCVCVCKDAPHVEVCICCASYRIPLIHGESMLHDGQEWALRDSFLMSRQIDRLMFQIIPQIVFQIIFQINFYNIALNIFFLFSFLFSFNYDSSRNNYLVPSDSTNL